MERVDKIRNHPLYQEQLKALLDAERDREFCRHTMQHFLDVARLMYLYTLEEGTELSKELIYATALLHDIGRYEQICGGRGHHEAGADLAGKIMKDCDFDCESIVRVQHAILKHRKESQDEDLLTVYLYRADKKSRLCFMCDAQDSCNWDETKKNMVIEL